MALVGSFVKHRLELVAGIIMRWDTNNPGCVIVRVWSEKKNDYVDRIFHPTSLISLDTWDEFEKLHDTSEEFKQIHNGIAMELALQTKDKEWFDQLTGKGLLVEEGEKL